MEARVAARARTIDPSAYLQLAKPGVTGLVIATVAAGALLASPHGMTPGVFLLVLLGSACAAGGTNALNQVAEREADARMERTRERPLPSGRLDPRSASLFAWSVSVAGVVLLGLAANPLTAIIAALTLILYVFVYTPLKRSSLLALPLGAIPGALPIIGGWTAVTGRIEWGGLALFLVLWLWQIPHFLSIGLLYREDYRRGGFRVLAVEDPSGRRSARRAVLFSGVLVPAAIVPGLLGVTGTISGVGGALLGCGLLAAACALQRRPSRAGARRLFLASIAYLPLMLGLLVADRTG